MRLSLGAGRGRILRQLLTEGLLLASLGGAAGVLVSVWAAQSIGTMAAGRLGIELPSRAALMDWRLFGTAAADSTSHGKGLLRMKNATAVGQLALVMTMLISAGLLARSAMHAIRANPGFDFGVAGTLPQERTAPGSDGQGGRIGVHIDTDASTMRAVHGGIIGQQHRLLVSQRGGVTTLCLWAPVTGA